MKNRVKKSLLLGTSIFLMSNSFLGVVYANTTNNSIEQTTENLKKQLEENTSDDVIIEDVSIDLLDGKIDVEATQDETIKIDITSELGIDGENSDDFESFTITQDNGEDIEEFGLFFGTKDEKQNLEEVIKKDEIILNNIINDVYSDEELENIELPLDTFLEDSENIITTTEDVDNSDITITNINTGEMTEISPEDGIAANPYIVPVGIYIAKQVAKSLIRQSLATIAKGVLNVSASYIATYSQTRKNYDHYRVIRHKKIGLVNIGGQSFNNAVALIKAYKDVWSTSSTNAYRVANMAGGGNPKRKPILDQAHQKGYFAHYHTFNRKGGHSFFGSARK